MQGGTSGRIVWVYSGIAVSAVALQAALPDLVFGVLLGGLLAIADAALSGAPRRSAMRCLVLGTAIGGALLIQIGRASGWLSFSEASVNAVPAIVAASVGCAGIAAVSRAIRRRAWPPWVGGVRPVGYTLSQGVESTTRSLAPVVEARLAGTASFMLLAIFGAAVVTSHRAAEDDAAFERAVRIEVEAGENFELAARAYRRYLSAHPAGGHVGEASEAINSLAYRARERDDDREWRLAKHEDTVASYSRYLNRSRGREWAHHMGDAEDALDVLRSADKEFERGRAVYIHAPSPAEVSQPFAEYTVRYVRDTRVRVRGELVVRYVRRGGQSAYSLGLPFASIDAGPLPLLSGRRGSLSASVQKVEGLDRVELIFMDRTVTRGVLRLKPLSNAVALPVK